MFRLFADSEGVREVLIHRWRSQHFEPRKCGVYEILFAERLKLRWTPTCVPFPEITRLAAVRPARTLVPRGRYEEPISRAPDMDFTPTRPATPTVDAQSGGVNAIREATRYPRHRTEPLPRCAAP